MDERPQTPHPPYDELRASLGDGDHTEGQAALDELHASLHKEPPGVADVEASVRRLRTIPVLEARISNWFESPRTQNWLQILNDAGL
jgi:hypothetical protein